jgi:hypothetical protein
MLLAFSFPTVVSCAMWFSPDRTNCRPRRFDSYYTLKPAQGTLQLAFDRPQASDLKEMRCELTLFSGKIVFQGDTSMNIS